MNMVVFGAGASFDSVPSRPPTKYPRSVLIGRPPLASELFIDSEPFSFSLRQFPQFKPIIPYLQAIPVDMTLEHALEILQIEAETDPVRKCQMAALRYYLHFVIWECERHWNDVAHGITNYVTLLDQLRRCAESHEPTLLVTFNYDRLLDDALRTVGVVIDDLPQYISSPFYKLFKLHGSVHWGREVESSIENIDSKSEWQIAQELIENIDEIKISNRYRMFGGHPIGRIDQTPLFPAVAIPVETKRGFECPADHLEYLRKNLSRVCKILVIGWRATEHHFLDLLKQEIKDQIPIQVVLGSKQDGENTLSHLHSAGIKYQGVVFEGGFTDYVVSRQAEEFFCA